MDIFQEIQIMIVVLVVEFIQQEIYHQHVQLLIVMSVLNKTHVINVNQVIL